MTTDSEMLAVIREMQAAGVTVADVQAAKAMRDARGVRVCHPGKLTYIRDPDMSYYVCSECGKEYIKGPKGTLLARIAGGSLDTISIAASVAILAYDMMSSRVDIAIRGIARLIKGISLTGSAAAGDSAVEIFIAGQKQGTFYNSATGFPTADAALFKVGPWLVPPSEPIRVPVVDAPATNPLNLQLDIVP
ncbi:MAG: hypothetical protein AAB368_15290 [bacterium]